MKKTLLCLIISLFFDLSLQQVVFTQKKKLLPRKPFISAPQVIPAASAPPLTSEAKKRIDSFNVFWFTLRNNYFDQTFNGQDWNQVKSEFEPKVLKTTTDAQLYDILQEIIFRLNRSHLAIIPPEVYQAIEKAKAEAIAKARIEPLSAKKENDVKDKEEPKDLTDFDDDYLKKYGIGIDLRLIDDKFVITGIDKGSAAELSGLKLGYAIEKVNGVSLIEVLQKVEVSYSKVRNVRRYMPKEIISWFLNGEKDSYISLTCLDESDELKEIKIQRRELKGQEISIGKNFPEQFLNFETKDINNETGYIKFNIFALPVIGKFCAALSELKDKKAIIVDLRGNSGGLLGSMIGLGGMLTDNSIDFGTSIYKVGSENLVAASKIKNYKGKLVFLVDDLTISAAEVFAAALQEKSRALIVGEKTAGEALPAVSVKLPTGAVFIYPIANFKTHNGNFLEGHGVEPNVLAKLDRKSLLQGKDNQIEAALKLIESDNSFSIDSSAPVKAPDIAIPPPPVPKPLPNPKKLAEVVVKIPPPPIEQTEIEKIDNKAIKIIDTFINNIGGAEALNKLSSYSIKGETNISSRGSETTLETEIYRQKPDKYVEIAKSETIGEIKEVYVGNKYFLQTDYGLERNYPIDIGIEKIEIFSPIYFLLRKDTFKSLIYRGIFDNQGRKAHVIEAKTSDGSTTAIAFDVETNLMVNFANQYSTITLSDYRPVENLRLPFRIERGFANKLDVREIKLNPQINEINFTKKENCFDKAI